MTARPPSDYRGDDKLLFGIILGVLAFWLFAQTTLNIAPAMAADLNVATSVMNIAVSITALFSGIFIVVIGGLADRLGRVKILMWGFVFSIVGSVLVGVAPSGALATPLLMLGRICQGLSGAFIMPASLALIKTYWDDGGRQRAVSLWSMGSWGGSGFAALFGGLMAENVGWRWIFFASAAVAVLGMLMVRGTPESKAAVQGSYTFDTKGVLTFMVTMVALARSSRATPAMSSRSRRSCACRSGRRRRRIESWCWARCGRSRRHKRRVLAAPTRFGKACLARCWSTTPAKQRKRPRSRARRLATTL